jgi:hypothetical protein
MLWTGPRRDEWFPLVQCPPARRVTASALLSAGRQRLSSIMPQRERLIIVPIPSVVATLLRAERQKGTPLTESEVIAIRDSCPSSVLSEQVAAEVIAKRGYDDVDLENTWESWQAIRPTLSIAGPAAEK